MFKNDPQRTTTVGHLFEDHNFHGFHEFSVLHETPTVQLKTKVYAMCSLDSQIPNICSWMHDGIIQARSQTV